MLCVDAYSDGCSASPMYGRQAISLGRAVLLLCLAMKSVGDAVCLMDSFIVETLDVKTRAWSKI